MADGKLTLTVETPDLDVTIAKLREANDLADRLKAKLAELAVPVVSVPSMWTYPNTTAPASAPYWITYTVNTGPQA